MTRKLRCRFMIFFFFALSIFLACFAQTDSSSAEVEPRIDKLLKQVSREEKMNLIGGVDGFYIRAIQRIGLPRLKMAEGPFGVRNYGPSTTLGGIGLAIRASSRFRSEIPRGRSSGMAT